MKDKELEIILKPLDEIKAAAVKKAYKEMEDSLALIDNEYDTVKGKEITTTVSGEARELRLRISKVRITGEKWKTKEKAQYIEAGKVIQVLYNKLREETLKREAVLKEIEDHFVNLEKERIQKIKDERLAALEPYNVDSSYVDLGHMTDEAWDAHFSGIVAAHEKAIADEEKEKENKILQERFEQRKELLLPYAQFNPYMDLYLETPEEEFQDLLERMVKEKIIFEEKQQKIIDENASLKKANELLRESSPSNPFKKDDLFGAIPVKEDPKEKEILPTKKELSVEEMMGFGSLSTPIETEQKTFDPGERVIEPTDKEILQECADYLTDKVKEAHSVVAKESLVGCINSLYGAKMLVK